MSERHCSSSKPPLCRWGSRCRRLQQKGVCSVECATSTDGWGPIVEAGAAKRRSSHNPHCRAPPLSPEHSPRTIGTSRLRSSEARQRVVVFRRRYRQSAGEPAVVRARPIRWTIEVWTPSNPPSNGRGQGGPESNGLGLRGPTAQAEGPQGWPRPEQLQTNNVRLPVWPECPLTDDPKGPHVR